MTTRIDLLLTQIIEEYSRYRYKSINYTDTYTRKFLLECISELTDRMMYRHCIEDRVIMAEMDDDYHEWIDKQAKEEQESKDAKVKDIPWNRLIMKDNHEKDSV